MCRHRKFNVGLADCIIGIEYDDSELLKLVITNSRFS